jgi:carboxypeptidase family protein
MKRPLLTAILLVCAAILGPHSLTLGQTNEKSATQKSSEQRGSSITGRVVNESGQPISNAAVYISAVGRQSQNRNASTDEDGKFRADDLPRGLYNVAAQVRGYTRATSQTTYYKPGDTVNVVLTKGGVITGTVTNSAGQPVIGLRVNAIQVRDLEGRPSGSLGGGVPRYTDDRGVYRLFALPSGVYLVATGSKPIQPSVDDDTPTYYPSETRDTAGEVVVNNGGEVTGIDIRYRGERGYAISGSIIGAPAKGSRPANVDVTLMRASRDVLEAHDFSRPRGNEQSFMFRGVPEGEYYILARRGPFESDDGASSRPVSVKLKNRDATGVEISLTPLGSAAGRIVLEPMAAKDKTNMCAGTGPGSRPGSIEETLISVRTDQQPPSYGLSESAPIASDDKGEFLIQALEPGQYRIESRMLDESWYVRAITAPGTARTAPIIDLGVDAGRNGFSVKAGQRVSGLTVIVAEGAVSLRGRVVTEKEGAALPERLRVHLIPAAKELADDTLRFAEAAVQSDGTFMLNNLAPGRYWLLTSQASPGEASERSPRPIAWKTSSRASLRRDAETANLSIELKPCQRITDYKLRYTPAKESPPKPGSN